MKVFSVDERQLYLMLNGNYGEISQDLTCSICHKVSFILCITKYHKTALPGERGNHLRDMIREVCKRVDIEII
jgi:hypothetical protein